jgi:excisionase family DNA binding protein
MGNSELMNTKEAAAYLGVTIYWLQTNWKSERIPAVRLKNRGRLHFRKSALDGWVKTQGSNRGRSPLWLVPAKP